MKYDLDAYARPLQEVNDDHLRKWAQKVEDLLNGAANPFLKWEIKVEKSELGTRTIVDITRTSINSGRVDNYALVPQEMGKPIRDEEDLLDAINAEVLSRDRSKAYVKGNVEAKVFENRYHPDEKTDRYKEPQKENDDMDERDDI